MSLAYSMNLAEGLRNEDWKFDERPDPTFLVSMCNTFQSFCTAESFEIVSAYTSGTLPSAQIV